MICENSKAIAYYNAMAPTTPTDSQKKASRSHSFSCSSTNAFAGRWPIAASTTNPILHTAPTASSKLPTTRPTTRSRTSSICSPQPDLVCSNVEVFLFTIFDLRIYATSFCGIGRSQASHRLLREDGGWGDRPRGHDPGDAQ